MLNEDQFTFEKITNGRLIFVLYHRTFFNPDTFRNTKKNKNTTMRLVTYQKVILVFIIVLKAKQRKALKNVGVAVICWSMRENFPK